MESSNAPVLVKDRAETEFEGMPEARGTAEIVDATEIKGTAGIVGIAGGAVEVKPEESTPVFASLIMLESADDAGVCAVDGTCD